MSDWRALLVQDQVRDRGLVTGAASGMLVRTLRALDTLLSACRVENVAA